MNIHTQRPLALALSALLAAAALSACSKPEPPAGEMPPPVAEPAPPPADTAPPPSDSTPPATDAAAPPPVEGTSEQTPPDQAQPDAKQQPAH